MTKKELLDQIEVLKSHNTTLIIHNQRLIKEKDCLIKAVGLIALKEIGITIR